MIKKQISNISGHQTSKVFALLYVLLAAPLLFIGIISFLFGTPAESPNGQPAPHIPWLFFIFAPLFYGAFGYVFTRIGCFAYNIIAKRFGGIEFTVMEKETSK